LKANRPIFAQIPSFWQMGYKLPLQMKFEHARSRKMGNRKSSFFIESGFFSIFLAGAELIAIRL